ncbi:MAG: hypothetical protein Q7S21_07460 [archaeon]|nr:hypothetical protein [archaeon]
MKRKRSPNISKEIKDKVISMRLDGHGFGTIKRATGLKYSNIGTILFYAAIKNPVLAQQLKLVTKSHTDSLRSQNVAIRINKLLDLIRRGKTREQIKKYYKAKGFLMVTLGEDLKVLEQSVNKARTIKEIEKIKPPLSRRRTGKRTLRKL